MKFPNVEDIATKDVISIAADATVRDALERMTATEIRNVVVERQGDGTYGILTVNDVIRLRACRADLGQSLATTGYRRLPTVRLGTNIFDVLRHFSTDDDYVCITDADGVLRGIISYTDIVTHIDPQVLIEQQRVGDIAGEPINTAAVESTLGAVFEQLATVSDAVVLLDGERPAGIITTKDAVRLLRKEVDFDAPAGRYMNAPLDTVAADVTVGEALAYIRKRHFKRIVIRNDQGALVGMINQRDLVDIAYRHWADMLYSQAGELRELVALLERKAKKLAGLVETDKLTGVFSRAKFEQCLDYEISRFERYGVEPFSIVLMDLDHFKAVNDNHGHLCGDYVLKDFAKLVSGMIRSVDVFARWGGEEFILILPSTPLDGARHGAERLRIALESYRFEGPGQITLSAGVAQYRPEEGAGSLVERADAALYRAKRGGRNQVETAQ